MSHVKIPQDAFAFYVALGTERSYQCVADHFHVSKRAIVKAANREQWAERLEAIERKTRELTDAKLVSDKHEQQMRHRKMLLAIGSRAAKAIQEFPLETGMQGIKAAELVIKLERLLAGESTERLESVDALMRHETELFLTTDEPAR